MIKRAFIYFQLGWIIKNLLTPQRVRPNTNKPGFVIAKHSFRVEHDIILSALGHGEINRKADKDERHQHLMKNINLLKFIKFFVNWFLLITFCLVIFSIPLFWFLKFNNQNYFSIIEGRELKRFSLSGLGIKLVLEELTHKNFSSVIDIFDDLFVKRDFQEMVDEGSSDQFPFRQAAFSISKGFDRLIIKLSYAFLPDPAIPTDMESGFHILRDNTAIIYSPNVFNEETKQFINLRINNYEKLIEKYPNKNFNIYHIERIQYSQHNPLNSHWVNADSGQSLVYFETNKPTELEMGKFSVKGINDYFNLIYRTDHHWSIHGIIKGYEEIYELLKMNNPQISPRLEFGEIITFPDIIFHGYTARTSFYPIEGEPFSVVDFGLPPYSVFINGKASSYGHMAAYLEGDYSTEPYVNHYGEFYGGNDGFLEFMFENDSERNLLIVGDSFKIAIQHLLAFHYHHTYAINPSRYGVMDLDELLLDYDIDEVLWIGGNNVLFEDPLFCLEP